MISLLRLLLGFIAGVAATGPMSAVMLEIHRRLPRHERYPLPPREITSKALDSMLGGKQLDPQVRSAATWLAHFGYGGAAGALYAQVNSRSRSWGGRGILFGVLVWVVSYFGLMPGLGVLRSASEQPVRRSGLMLLAHLVWGWVLAGLFRSFSRDAEQVQAAFDSSPAPHRDRA